MPRPARAQILLPYLPIIFLKIKKKKNTSPFSRDIQKFCGRYGAVGDIGSAPVLRGLWYHPIARASHINV